MKKCVECGTIVGKTGVKKCFCYFCYRAFCSGCLKETAIHPETMNPERICQSCFIFHVKMQVVEAGADYVVYCLRNEIKLKEESILLTQQIETRLKDLKTQQLEQEAAHCSKIEIKREELQKKIKEFEEADKEFAEYAEELNKVYNQFAIYDEKSKLEKMMEKIIP